MDRILATVTLGLGNEGDPSVAIEFGGWHAAEALIIARYMMFTQVYFHRVRQALDHHVEGVLSHLLRNDTTRTGDGVFPSPLSAESLRDYLDWDDWKVFGEIAAGNSGEHGECIKERNHDRCIRSTNEVPTEEEIQELGTYSQLLGELVTFVGNAS